jgi:hypothetical protein
MNAFVVRTEFTDPEHGNEFLDSMREGLARIGWSYQDGLDLASIVQAIIRDSGIRLAPTTSNPRGGATVLSIVPRETITSFTRTCRCTVNLWSPKSPASTFS